MNEINARLVQHLAINNLPPVTAPVPEEVNRSCHSHRSGDQDSQNRHSVGQGHSTRRRRWSPCWDDQAHKRRDKSTIEKIKDLDARIDAINTGVKAPVTVDALIRKTEPSFIERVMKVMGSSRFKLPSQLGVYKGKTDPMDHLDSYKNLMML